MAKKPTRLLIVAALVALVLMMFGLLHEGYVLSQKLANLQLRGKVRTLIASTRTSRDFQSDWSVGGFVPLTEANIASLCSNLPLHSQVKLSHAEEKQLRETAGRFLRAYSSGDFDNFLAFRFPTTNGTFVPRLLALDAAYLITNAVYRPSFDTNNPWSQWRARWLFPTSCTNCLTHLATNRSGIAVTQSARLPNVAQLVDLMDFYGSVASANTTHGWFPRFTFDPSPDQVVTNRGTIKTALIWVVARVRGDQSKPVYCQVYYSPEVGKWLPCFVGYAGKPKLSYWFFF